jgi:hypothetical protein
MVIIILKKKTLSLSRPSGLDANGLFIFYFFKIFETISVDMCGRS